MGRPPLQIFGRPSPRPPRSRTGCVMCIYEAIIGQLSCCSHISLCHLNSVSIDSAHDSAVPVGVQPIGLTIHPAWQCKAWRKEEEEEEGRCYCDTASLNRYQSPSL